MFQGPLPRLMVGRLLLALGVLGCLLLPASGASASAEARVSVERPAGPARCAIDRAVLGLPECRSSELALEVSPAELERRTNGASALVSRRPLHAAACSVQPAGGGASRFGQSGARMGRGAKGARDPGEVQPELPAG